MSEPSDTSEEVKFSNPMTNVPSDDDDDWTDQPRTGIRVKWESAAQKSEASKTKLTAKMEDAQKRETERKKLEDESKKQEEEKSKQIDDIRVRQLESERVE